MPTWTGRTPHRLAPVVLVRPVLHPHVSPYSTAWQVYAQQRGNRALASREELSQEERKALRRRKKRVHARKTSETEAREALRATLLPDSMSAKRREATRLDKDLTEAKRKGEVLTGQPADPAGDGAKRSGAAYTRSAQFFGRMQNEKAAGSGDKAAGKRKDLVGDPSPTKSSRYKL